MVEYIQSSHLEAWPPYIEASQSNISVVVVVRPTTLLAQLAQAHVRTETRTAAVGWYFLHHYQSAQYASN